MSDENYNEEVQNSQVEEANDEDDDWAENSTNGETLESEDDASVDEDYSDGEDYTDDSYSEWQQHFDSIFLSRRARGEARRGILPVIIIVLSASLTHSLI